MNLEDTLTHTARKLQKLDSRAAIKTLATELNYLRQEVPALAGEAELRALDTVSAYLNGRGDAENCQRYGSALASAVVGFEREGLSALERAQREYSFACAWLALAVPNPNSGRLDYVALNLAEAWLYPPGHLSTSHAYKCLNDNLQQAIDVIHERALGKPIPRSRTSLLAS